jgi:hypothetical protein
VSQEQMTKLASIAVEGDTACSLDTEKLVATSAAQRARKVAF